MSSDGEKAEELLEDLALDIKALVLLHNSDQELRARIHSGLLESKDEEVKRFVGSLQRESRAEPRRLAVMAAGELLLASFLVVAGTIATVPGMVGITSADGLSAYFAGKVFGVFSGSPLNGALQVIELVSGVALLVSALYTLRQAASHLREAGLHAGPAGG